METIEDENGMIILIYFQLPAMKAYYKLFGQVLQLDGTYTVVLCGMTLVNIVGQDNHGNTVVLAHFFVRRESIESIASGLQFFKRARRKISLN